MPWHSAPATFVTLPAGILRVLDGFWVAVQEKPKEPKGLCSTALFFFPSPFLSPDNKLSDGFISSQWPVSFDLMSFF